MTKPHRKRGATLWVCVAGVALLELIVHAVIVARVPDSEAWGLAAAYVRERFETGDRIVAAPRWADPIARFYLGDLMSLRTASVDDLPGAERLWELSIRSASFGDDVPEIDLGFGGVRIRRWPLAAEDVLFDFAESVELASVELATPQGAYPCPWTDSDAGGGGLGRGPLAPPQRFLCDPGRPWLWVGPTVAADLRYAPHRCIWQHPAGPEPLRVVFPEVPLGDRLVLDGGLESNNARRSGGSPVVLRVLIDGWPVGELEHRGQQDWTRLEVDTRAFAGTRREVTVETTTASPAGRTFCWMGSTRRARGAP